MPLFTKSRKCDVQTFVLKLVNNNCPELRAMCDGPRSDSRVNLSLALMVVPIEGEQLMLDDAFAAVTKEFSVTGVSLILSEPRGLDKAALAFRVGEERIYMRGKAKHLNPMGCGFFQLGFELHDILNAADWPELDELLL